MRYRPLTRDILFTFSAAAFAFKIDNEKLFESIVKDSSRTAKDEILAGL